jgi:hypothetical protein
MALQRMKWSNSDASLIRTQARDGAQVRQIDEPRPPRRRAEMDRLQPSQQWALATAWLWSPRPSIRAGEPCTRSVGKILSGGP